MELLLLGKASSTGVYEAAGNANYAPSTASGNAASNAISTAGNNPGSTTGASGNAGPTSGSIAYGNEPGNAALGAEA